MKDKIGREIKIGQAIAYGHHGYAGLTLYEVMGFTPQQVKCKELVWHRNYVEGAFTKEYFPWKGCTNLKFPDESLILIQTPEEIMHMTNPNHVDEG